MNRCIHELMFHASVHSSPIREAMTSERRHRNRRHQNRRTWPVSLVLHFLLSSTDHQATTEHFKTRQEPATTQTRTSGEALRLAVVGVRFLFFFWLKFPCCSAFKWLKLSSILVFPASQVSLSFSRQVGETFERTFFLFDSSFLVPRATSG